MTPHPCLLHAFVYDGHMYDQWYNRISKRWRPHARALSMLDRALVAAFAAAYVILLVWLLATGDPRFAKALLVPAISFVVVSIVRALINEPRPYEHYEIDPIIHKDTHGKSMPGRHMFSATIISCTLLLLNPVAGVIGFIGCGLIAFTRIVGGVHYPRDIIVAFLVGVGCAALGYIVIP